MLEYVSFKFVFSDRTLFTDAFQKYLSVSLQDDFLKDSLKQH